jgi:hypothetical protein
MSRFNESDIDNLLDNWSRTKKDISDLQLKCDKYKKLATRMMNKMSTSELESDQFILKRKKITRSSLARDDIPKTLWDTYSKSSSYEAFYLSENN